VVYHPNVLTVLYIYAHINTVSHTPYWLTSALGQVTHYIFQSVVHLVYMFMVLRL
jgi:hypothetical protein